MKLNLRLNKRYFRSVKSNIIFYIAASILTMLSVLAFALLFTSGLGIKNYTSKVFKTDVVEDADFSALMQIDDEEIKSIEEKYHVLLEHQQYVNILNSKTYDKDGNDVTKPDTHARIFRENFKINIYTITQTKPGLTINSIKDLKDDEIIINEKYAIKHNISLDSDNSKIEIDNKFYKIVGYFVRPDYLYGLEEATDTYANYDSFFIAYLNDDAFYEFLKDEDGKTSVSNNYALKYNQNGTTDVSALRTHLFNEYVTYQYNVASTSGRIRAISTRSTLYMSFSFLILIIMPISVVALIAIILNIKVKNDQKIIGTIQALGYRNKEICYHYSIMAILPGLIGGILMTIFIYITVGFFGKLASGDFEVMKISFVYPWYTAILGVLIPTLIYFVTSVITVKTLINKPVTTLLRGAGTSSKSSKFLTKKRMNTSLKFSIRSLLINKGRAFVVFLGIAASAMIITIALSSFDTIDAIVTDAMKKAGDFEYEYTLKMPQSTTDEDLKSGNNYMLATIYEYNDRKIPLMGADADNMDLWYTTLTNGNKITKLDNDSFYMSKLCATLMGVNEGDTITINSNFNEEKLTFKITGIIDNGLLSYVLTSKNNVIKSYLKTIKSFLEQPAITELLPKNVVDQIDSALSDNLKEQTTLYNIVLSKDSLESKFEAHNILTIFQKSSIIKQKDAKLSERTPIIYTVLIIGILICVIAVFTVVNVIIEDNQGNISMLMVLGYKPREINRMIINGNHILVPLGLGIGIPLGHIILKAYFRITIQNANMIMPASTSFKTVMMIIGIIVGTYVITLLLLKHKASRVSMTDSLKDNR